MAIEPAPQHRREDATASDRDLLIREWRRLGRVATLVAALKSPGLYLTLVSVDDWSPIVALIVAILAVAAFRGTIDIIANRLIPRPSLYGADDQLKQEDVLF